MRDISSIDASEGAISIGAELFADALEGQGVQVTRVAWRPPAGDARILARLLNDEVAVVSCRSFEEHLVEAGGACTAP